MKKESVGYLVCFVKPTLRLDIIVRINSRQQVHCSAVGREDLDINYLGDHQSEFHRWLADQIDEALEASKGEFNLPADPLDIFATTPHEQKTPTT